MSAGDLSGNPVVDAGLHIERLLVFGMFLVAAICHVESSNRGSPGK